MMEHLSSSQITLYLQCSLKYRFQYIDQLPKPFKPSAVALGSAIHSTLSWLHKERMKGNEVSLERLYKIFDTDWFAQKVETDIRYRDKEGETNLVIMAKELLGLYFQMPAKEIKATEVPFVVPLINPANGKTLGISLEGIIDLIEKDDTIVEFKTSYQAINLDEISNDLQLTAYSYAYEILYQKPPRLLKLINFVKTRRPKMSVLETKRDKIDYQRFFYLASQVLKGIKSQIFFPRAGFYCKDCEYEMYCQAWEGS